MPTVKRFCIYAIILELSCAECFHYDIYDSPLSRPFFSKFERVFPLKMLPGKLQKIKTPHAYYRIFFLHLFWTILFNLIKKLFIWIAFLCVDFLSIFSLFCLNYCRCSINFCFKGPSFFPQLAFFFNKHGTRDSLFILSTLSSLDTFDKDFLYGIGPWALIWNFHSVSS